MPGAASPAAAYRAYFAALQRSDHAGAAVWLSDYSLRAQEMTREGVRDELKMGVYGALRYLDLQVQEVRMVDPALGGAPTAIIHSRVTLQQGMTAPRVQEQWNTARHEGSGWLINAGGLIDRGRADVPPQTLHGVTVRLLGLQRYATHARLILQVTNRNDQAVWWGGGSSPALTLWSGDKVVRVPGQALRFDARQSYPTIVADVDQSLPAYPTRVELARWSEARGAQEPSWSYAFDVPGWQAPE